MAVENKNPFLIAIALAAFLTGLSKGGLGGMIGVLIMPMMALVILMDLAIGLLLPILMLGDAFAVAAHWRRWEGRLIRILLAGALVGVTVGTFFITNMSVDVLRCGLGIIVLLFVLYRLFESQIIKFFQYKRQHWHGLLAGGIADFTPSLAHAGGPPITIYLLLQDLPPAAFMATSVLFFAVLNWIKVPYNYYASLFHFDLLLRLIWFAPLVPLGAWIGKKVVYRVNKVLFNRLILVLPLISGVLLLVR